MATQTFKIAIIGAGLGGCMLTRLLHYANVNFTIFEAEASVDFRSRGGMLDLRKNGPRRYERGGIVRKVPETRQI
jgi:2-polyprenyl-6-methoxyphenol hydroxylase-like FAD-dependent oxidoreductase